MSTTKNGRRKKLLKCCEDKHDRLEGAVSKNREGRKTMIKNLTEKISAKKSYAPKVSEDKPQEKKGKKGKK